MEIDEYTYSHQIIDEAYYLIKNNNSIDVNYSPLGLILAKIFGHLMDEKLNISTPKNEDLYNVVENFETEKINNIIQYIKNKSTQLEDIEYPSDVALKNFKSELQILILLSLINNHDEIESSIKIYTEKFLKKFQTFENQLKDFRFLVNLYNNYEIEDLNITPISNMSDESLIELILFKIQSNPNYSIDKEIIIKMKKRRLLFIKKIHDQLNLFKDPNNVLKPSPQIVENIFFASIVLKIMGYDKSISLNKYDSEAYIGKEENLSINVEAEINKKVKDILIFKLVLPQINLNINIPLHLYIIIITVLWSLLLILLLIILNLHTYINSIILSIIIGIITSIMGSTLALLSRINKIYKSLNKNKINQN
jgi:hypothetical protein